MTTRAGGELLEEALTRSVIGAFFEVHKELGFGFREHLYALALERDLIAKGHRVAREVAVTVSYRGAPLAWQTLDMIVDERLVLEFKASERLHPDAELQLFGYLRATRLEVGLVLHFGRHAKFHRVVCQNAFKGHQSAETGRT
jgi:GxxExxY protein